MGNVIRNIADVGNTNLDESGYLYYDISLNWYVKYDSSVGAAGTQGIQGITGVGTQGAQGIQGITGSQGIQGIIGTQGTTGSQGIQGIIGTQGIQGRQGITGSQGSQGTQGTTGSQGIQGIIGTQGTIGSQGIQGIIGSQGTTGSQGIQGIIGTGVQGTQGITGGSLDSSLWDISTNGINVFLRDPCDNLQLSYIEMQPDGGPLLFVDMPIAAAASSTEESYTMRIDGSNALKVYGLTSGSGANLSETGVVVEATYFSLGDPQTDGSWRFRINAAGDLAIERRVSGSWTEKGSFT